MSTATITHEVNTSPAPPQISQSSPVGSAAAASTAEPTSSSVSSASSSGEGSPPGSAPRHAGIFEVPQEQSHNELSLQDFDSLEDFAQALIDKKQSAVSPQPSAEEVTDTETEVPDSGPEEDQTAELETQPEEESHPAVDPNVELDLDTEDFLSTKGLNDRINANAALKQALEADQPLRHAMFRNARLAGEAAGYQEIFPDVESARLAADQAAEFAALDHAFLNAGSRDGAEKFFSRWAEMAMLNDADGNLLRDQHGNPRMHGAWSAVNQHLFNSQLDYIRNKAEKTGNHELLAALDVIRESTHSSSSRALDPGSPSRAGVARDGVVDDLPPHLKAAADSINRREQELTRAQQAAAAARAEAFDFSVAEEASAKINSLVEPVLEKAALSDFVRQTAREKIENAIVDSLGRNRFFQARMAELKRLPINDEAMQHQLNLIMTHVHAIAGPIVRQVLREASQPVIKAQEERAAKIESQIARTRSEPRSVGGAALNGAGANQRPEQLLATAREQLRDELGDEPNLQQVIERFARLKANR